MPIDVQVDPELTEMVDIDPERVDGVANPANGFPTLMLKGIDEKPDKEPVVADAPVEDAQKGAEETTEAVEPQESVQEDVQKEVIEAAVAEAMKSRDAAIEELRDELAKVKATPIPGGPVLTVPASVRAERDRNELLAKAAHYERMASEVIEPDLRAHYSRMADGARKGIV